jgi:PIN domain nuclease of toxin-antitoxin system
MTVEELPIARRHVQGVGSLPFHHRNPFDTLLIAQAQAENLILVGGDTHFAAHRIKLLPA